MKDQRKSRDELVSELIDFRKQVTTAQGVEEERQKAEKVLKETEKRYTALFNGMLNAVALHEMLLDKRDEPHDYRFLEVNPAFEKLTGLKKADIVGRNASVVLPEGDPWWLKTYGEVVRTGNPVHFERYSKSLDKHLEVAAFRYRRNRFAVSFADVTQRRKAEAELRRSQELYMAVVEDQSELICRCLPDGKLTFANDAYCRYFGKPAEELVGHSFMALIPEEDYEEVRKKFEALSAESPVVAYKHRVMFPDGRLRWQEWTDRAVIGADGKIVEYQSVGRDVTERKQAEDELDRYHNRLEEIVEERTANLKEINEKLQGEVAERRKAEEEGKKLQTRLQDALSKALSGYLAICSRCKRIRDDEGNWIPLEMYMVGRTEAEFTHGVCPYCMKKLYPDLGRHN